MVGSTQTGTSSTREISPGSGHRGRFLVAVPAVLIAVRTGCLRQLWRGVISLMRCHPRPRWVTCFCGSPGLGAYWAQDQSLELRIIQRHHHEFAHDRTGHARRVAGPFSPQSTVSGCGRMRRR